MQERILGTECEYALYHRSGQSRRWLEGKQLLANLEKTAALLVARQRTSGFARAGEFLANGGRFYIDRGGHPEYATPECRSVRDLVTYEKAGDRLLQELVEGARQLIGQEDNGGSLQVFKNNVDPGGHTYGHHENYLINPLAWEGIQAIIPFLVTRQVFAGAGRVIGDGSGINSPFRLSQRSDFIERVFHDGATQTRGIITTRKRELYRPGQNIRLHLIIGDSNMSEYAIGLKIGVTAMVLRLLEEGALEDFPALAHPLEALRAVSQGLDQGVALDARPGRFTAQEIQSMYLERAHRFFAIIEPTAEEAEVLQQWAQILSGLKQMKLLSTGFLEEDPGEVRRKVDWALKLWLISRTEQKSNLNWDDHRLKLLDYSYHGLDPQTGLFEQCVAQGLAEQVVEEGAVRRAQSEPPANTRAWLRGTIIKSAMGKKVEVVIKDWDSMNLLAGDGKPVRTILDRLRPVRFLKVNLSDPFHHQNPSVLGEVEHFLESCQ